MSTRSRKKAVKTVTKNYKNDIEKERRTKSDAVRKRLHDDEVRRATGGRALDWW